jgi:hypothetical protein
MNGIVPLPGILGIAGISPSGISVSGINGIVGIPPFLGMLGIVPVMDKAGSP